ncbi:MAG: type II secretion system protein [Planctomycetota bacterium]
MHAHEGEEGFTLIELMIVTTVIGVLASVAVPNLLSSRVAANETAVIATLRAVATAQAQFITTSVLDTDGNGIGEYGTFGELGALEPLRGGTTPIGRNLLSASVAKVEPTGWASHHGFHFAMYLPDASGAGVPALAANAATIDARLSQGRWTCIAWPNNLGQTGTRTFFVNEQGLLLQAREATYSGTASVPAAGAALLGGAATQIDLAGLAANTVGADGNRWTVVQ